MREVGIWVDGAGGGVWHAGWRFLRNAIPYSKVKGSMSMGTKGRWVGLENLRKISRASMDSAIELRSKCHGVGSSKRQSIL